MLIIHHFYSDPHFGHTNILEYANRPFSDTKEMEEVFIERYNDHVDQNDVVLWCGDCSYRLQELPEILSRMNGRKILIRGNHDKAAGYMAKLGFDLVMDELVLHIGNRTCRVSHYPYFGANSFGGRVDTRYPDRRPKKHKGEVLIHGHSHSQKRRDGNMIHVGVDAWDYRPASFEEVAALVAEV